MNVEKHQCFKVMEERIEVRQSKRNNNKNNIFSGFMLYFEEDKLKNKQK